MSERMTAGRAVMLRRLLRESICDTSRTERDAIADDWKRARASEDTLITQLSAKDKALRVAQEALLAEMREMSITGWHRNDCPTMNDMDNPCSPLCRKDRDALAAIEEAGRG